MKTGGGGGGGIFYYPVLPSTAISGSIAQPGKTRVFPPGFSRAVNTLPTLVKPEWLFVYIN